MDYMTKLRQEMNTVALLQTEMVVNNSVGGSLGVASVTGCGHSNVRINIIST